MSDEEDEWSPFEERKKTAPERKISRQPSVPLVIEDSDLEEEEEKLHPKVATLQVKLTPPPRFTDEEEEPELGVSGYKRRRRSSTITGVEKKGSNTIELAEKKLLMDAAVMQSGSGTKAGKKKSTTEGEKESKDKGEGTSVVKTAKVKSVESRSDTPDVPGVSEERKKEKKPKTSQSDSDEDKKEKKATKASKRETDEEKKEKGGEKKYQAEKEKEKIEKELAEKTEREKAGKTGEKLAKREAAKAAAEEKAQRERSRQKKMNLFAIKSGE